MPFKAVAFDLDGTLVKEESSWYKLHSHFGTLEQSKANMCRYESGKICYDEFMSLDIGLWKPAPTKAEIQKILLNYTLSINVKDIVTTLKQKGYDLFIVTSAPDILAMAVANELQIEKVACNTLIFDNENKILPKAVFNVDLITKDKAFREILAKSRLECTECIAIGDNKYDITFLKSSGLGITYNPDDVLRKEAFASMENFNELLKFI